VASRRKVPVQQLHRNQRSSQPETSTWTQEKASPAWSRPPKSHHPVNGQKSLNQHSIPRILKYKSNKSHSRIQIREMRKILWLLLQPACQLNLKKSNT
jgi:hypothetical protein